MPNAQIQNTKHLLKKYGIRPSKRLGQNFLIDRMALKKLIETANLSEKDTVLEIGPGLGVITIELARRAKRVIAIEKDQRMCDILLEILDAGNVRNVQVINQDILSYKLQVTSYKLVANLPYYLTAPVIRKFLEAEHKPKEMILMIQKEVAQRICAKPGKMSILAVGIQLYALPKIISYISKKSFWPIPKVDSAIIKIIPRKSALLSASFREEFFRIVRMGFSSKRKMLKNNLKLDESTLKKLGFNPKVRAENLSVPDWIKLYENL